MAGSLVQQVRRFKVLDRDTKAESHDVVPWTQEVQLAALFATWPGRLLARSSCLRAYFRRRSEAKGRRYDSAQGAKQHIQQFIKDFSVNVDESERPFSEYATLNEFFARRLKDGLRPIDAPEDDQLLCCPCDGRYSCYQSLGAVRLLWIKGRHFSIAELVGATSRGALDGAPAAAPELATLAKRRFRLAAVTVARLAPTDYHRVHSPCKGRVAKVVHIGGEYFPVKPVAVTARGLDVLTTNRRVVVQIDPPNEQMGPIWVVLVGAIEVGSIVLDIKEGDVLEKGQEMGYFQYGGSTVVVVHRIQVCIEKDLLVNSCDLKETYCKVGQRLAHNVAQPPEGDIDTWPKYDDDWRYESSCPDKYEHSFKGYGQNL